MLLVVFFLISTTVSAQTSNYKHPTMGWTISMPPNWLFGHNMSYYGCMFLIHQYLPVQKQEIAPPPPPNKYSSQFKPLDTEDLGDYEIVYYLKDTNNVNRIMIQTSTVADMYKNDTGALYTYITHSASNILADERFILNTNISRESIQNRSFLVTTTKVQYKKKLLVTMENYYWTDGKVLLEAYISYDNVKDSKIMMQAFYSSIKSF